MTDRRITLIASRTTTPTRDWNYGGSAHSSTAFLESIDSLRSALTPSMMEAGFDFERAIVDGAGTADDFLKLVARLPVQFTGDVLHVNDDGAGYLSAAGRGGDRVLYALTAYDIRFYLEAYDLVTGRMAMEKTA
jgi:hypothetical protein